MANAFENLSTVNRVANTPEEVITGVQDINSKFDTLLELVKGMKEQLDNQNVVRNEPVAPVETKEEELEKTQELDMQFDPTLVAGNAPVQETEPTSDNVIPFVPGMDSPVTPEVPTPDAVAPVDPTLVENSIPAQNVEVPTTEPKQEVEAPVADNGFISMDQLLSNVDSQNSPEVNAQTDTQVLNEIPSIPNIGSVPNADPILPNIDLPTPTVEEEIKPDVNITGTPVVENKVDVQPNTVDTTTVANNISAEPQVQPAPVTNNTVPFDPTLTGVGTPVPNAEVPATNVSENVQANVVSEPQVQAAPVTTNDNIIPFDPTLAANTTPVQNNVTPGENNVEFIDIPLTNAVSNGKQRKMELGETSNNVLKNKGVSGGKTLTYSNVA